MMLTLSHSINKQDSSQDAIIYRANIITSKRKNFSQNAFVKNVLLTHPHVYVLFHFLTNNNYINNSKQVQPLNCTEKLKFKIICFSI